MAEQKIKPAPEGFVNLKSLNVSHEGIEYIAENGILTVPVQVAEFLILNHQVEPV